MRRAGLRRRVIDVEVKRYVATASHLVAPNAQTLDSNARRAISLAGEPFQEGIPSPSKNE